MGQEYPRHIKNAVTPPLQFVSSLERSESPPRVSARWHWITSVRSSTCAMGASDLQAATIVLPGGFAFILAVTAFAIDSVRAADGVVAPWSIWSLSGRSSLADDENE